MGSASLLKDSGHPEKLARSVRGVGKRLLHRNRGAWNVRMERSGSRNAISHLEPWGWELQTIQILHIIENLGKLFGKMGFLFRGQGKACQPGDMRYLIVRQLHSRNPFSPVPEMRFLSGSFFCFCRNSFVRRALCMEAS
jgi:hypothetical protein